MDSRTLRRTIAVGALGAVLLLSGCASTRNTLFVEIDDASRAGDFPRAVELTEENQDRLYGNRDGVLFYLDTGMLHHYAGNFQVSTQRLSEAERLIEEYFTRSVRQAAASLLLNDNQLDYAGEDFEDIYLNVFNALSFISMGNPEGAFVEIRRISNKLNLLEDKYQGLAAGYNQSDEKDGGPAIQPGTSRFYNSALARYLSLVMYRAAGNYDGVRIDWQQMQEAFNRQSNLYTFPMPLTAEVMTPPADARLSVLAFTGRSPIKLASTLWITTQDNRVTIAVAQEDERAGRVLQGYESFAFPGVEAGYRFKFELPRMVLRGSEVTGVRVFADGRLLGELGMLEDMQQIALDTFQIREPIIFLKTVTRTIIKGVAAQRAGRAMQEAGAQSGSTFGLVAGIVGSIAADVAVDASEQADLRISRFFPAFAHVGEWDLPAGQYDIRVEYHSPRGLLFTEELGEVSVTPGEPNLVSSFFNN